MNDPCCGNCKYFRRVSDGFGVCADPLKRIYHKSSVPAGLEPGISINMTCLNYTPTIQATLEAHLKRCVKVQQRLLDVANGKISIPADPDQFREWASRLGVPEDFHHDT